MRLLIPDSLIEFEDFYPEIENAKEIYEPIKSHELSLLDNIQSMNKLSGKAISNEFYKLFAKFEKPDVSFWTIIYFVWSHLGGAVRLVFCLFLTSILLGGTSPLTPSRNLLHTQGNSTRRNSPEKHRQNEVNQGKTHTRPQKRRRTKAPRTLAKINSVLPDPRTLLNYRLIDVNVSSNSSGISSYALGSSTESRFGCSNSSGLYSGISLCTGIGFFFPSQNGPPKCCLSSSSLCLRLELSQCTVADPAGRHCLHAS